MNPKEFIWHVKKIDRHDFKSISNYVCKNFFKKPFPSERKQLYHKKDGEDMTSMQREHLIN